MVTKWFGVRNTVTTINTSVSKVEKHLPVAISFLNTIRGEETVALSETQRNIQLE